MRQKVQHIATLILFAHLAAPAQTDTMVAKARMLQPVYTMAKLSKYGSSLHIQALDSINLANATGSVADLIQSSTSATVRSYGHSGIALASIRGANPSQVVVLWNGLAINQLSNSLVDLNLVPSFFVDQVALHYGGNSTSWATGDVGGNIHLLNRVRFAAGNSAKVQVSAGSYGQRTLNVGVATSGNKSYHSTKLHAAFASNNYQYRDPLTAAGVRAKFIATPSKQLALLQEAAWLLPANWRLDAKVWVQTTMRDLPYSIYQSYNLQQQTDRHIRAKVDLMKERGTSKHYLRVAQILEELQYRNASIGVADTYRTLQTNVEYEYAKKISTTHALYTTCGLQYGEMSSARYIQKPVNSRVYSKVAWLFADARRCAKAAARIEVFDGNINPLVYEASYAYMLSKKWKVEIGHQQNFRRPTFNDLYWAAGGNTALQPERSRNSEIQATLHAAKWLTAQFAVYYKATKDNLVWLPDSTGRWHAANIGSVRASGVDVQASGKIAILPQGLAYSVNYGYCSVQDHTKNSEYYGKQLIYVPLHKASGSLRTSFGAYLLAYNVTFLGRRFITADNLDDLGAAWQHQMSLSKGFTFTKMSFNASFAANNIFGNQLEVLPGRPAPLQNYILSLRAELHKAK
jgi:vitamin B12 transporter